MIWNFNQSHHRILIIAIVCFQLQLAFFIQQIHYVAVWISTFHNMIQEGDDD
jgi:hypothetical protein